MPKSLPNRVTGGQSRLLHVLPANPTTLEGHGERGNDHHATGEQQERDLPTVVHEERLPEAGRTRTARANLQRSRDPWPASSCQREQAAPSGDDDGERCTGEPEANEYAGRQVEGERRRAYGHKGYACGVDNATSGEDAGRTVAVGYGPANGCPRPQTMFCIAMARANTSGDQPRPSLIGVANRPKLVLKP